MKKVFAICAIAVAMVACNNEASTVDAEKAAADSARVADSIKAAEAMKMAPAPDSLSTPMTDSATKVAADSTKK